MWVKGYWTMESAKPIKVRADHNLPARRWWLLYGSSVPNLQKLAVRVLSQVVSSSSCERINSEADHIKSIKKSRMLTQTLQQHLAVHHNLKFLINYLPMNMKRKL